ncbi:MAG: hypothetical protein DSZ10_03030 [Sulfurovum sp.]|nr:MAG: hypothetical protein DSZ10_03030 [Sulfurovum sp.]
MKKLWLWLGLLLLLMILCIVTKIDDIHLTHKQHSLSSTTNTVHQDRTRPIAFDIVQNGKNYQLSGRFKDTAQQQRIQNAFADTQHTLHIDNTSSNKTLSGEEVIVLVESIIPHFATTYEDGSIHFHNNRLTVNGTVHSYDAKRKMEYLLSTSTVPTQDNTVVILPKEPVSFRIDETRGVFSILGNFANAQESQMLIGAVPGMHTGELNFASKYTDGQNVIPFTQKLLPFFASHFNEGEIVYQNGVLTISGLAKDQASLDQLSQMLAQAPCKVINNTKLDPAVLEALRAQKAAQEARLQAEEEARRAAALKAAKAEEARLKAEQEAAQAQRERLRLAQQAAEEAKAAKAKIIDLLKVENIEFEVAKDRLTPKGRATVDKLAAILKQYPHIRVEIAGHTDSDGNDDFNLRLSQARVDTVKNALISQGIDASRMIAKGYGESRPLVPNDTAENKQKNRRVEINIIGE